MRIVAGDLGGRRLVVPSGRDTRPTTDRVREAIFSMIGDVDGLDVLDVFAGSGALGIEALSRGAASATFIDRSSGALASLRANLSQLGLEARATVVARDWRAALAAERSQGRVYGLCLIDPPYSVLPRIAADLCQAIAQVVSSGSTVVIEGDARTGPIPFTELGLTDRTDRAYGTTHVSVIRMVGE
jgi:16S rRNA (guanine966-N2)-methyltransferase